MTRANGLSQTRLVHAERGCRIDRKPAGLMPLALNEEDGPVPVIQAWILECTLRVGDPWRTMEKYTYIICQWYDFLRGINVRTLEAHENHLRDFLLGGGLRFGNVRSMGQDTEVPASSSNLTKYRVIVSFYDFWENKRGKDLRIYHGGTLATLRETVLTRKHRSISRAELNFTKAEGQSEKDEPGTPSEDEAEMVLDRALEHKDQNRAQTWYLIGSLALRSGGRVGGICSLEVKRLFAGLKKERAFKGCAEILDGHLLAGNRTKIVAILQRMKADRRTYIFCNIRNKGGELIPMAIPINLCVESVEYICTHRQDVVNHRFGKANVKPPPNIFLSYKVRQAGGALSSEAVSNFFNPILKELEIDGTIHRFRSTFAEQVLRDIYIRERATNGRAWQINNILQLASKLLGHMSPESIRHYLNNIMAQEIFFGEPVMVGSTENASYLRAVAAQLDDIDNDQFRDAFRQFLMEQGIEPITEQGRRYALF